MARPRPSPLDVVGPYFLMGELPMRRFRNLTMIGLLAASTLLAGCNTIAGIGRDVQSAGETVEDAAT